MTKFLIAARTDIGRTKQVNQDAVLVEEAEADIGPILFAAVSDGMGGLAMGEMASTKMSEALSAWFENSLAAFVSRHGTIITYEEFQNEMEFIIRKVSKEIETLSTEMSGTTITGMLIAAGTYYIVHVGDSRAYAFRERLIQLTKDQTFVQRELDRGNIREEEIETHPKRSVLLQCVGASEIVIPEFQRGTYQEGDLFLLCSDGFRHKISIEEFNYLFSTDMMQTEEGMDRCIRTMIEKIKERGEKDNITAILIRVGQSNA